MKTAVIQWILGGAGALVLSGVARSIDALEPDATSSKWYRFAYRLAQNLLMNFDKADAAKKKQ